MCSSGATPTPSRSENGRRISSGRFGDRMRLEIHDGKVFYYYTTLRILDANENKVFTPRARK
jgi:hypothetical protein